jgi:hypothetical protein
MSKKSVEGIILILSCQKHKNTRLKEFKLNKNEYVGWQVIYVLGDLFIENDYIFKDNIMTIKCEDSYIHLLKKLVLSIKYIYSVFDIKQGILRSGDDLLYNEKLLIDLLNLKKPDFYGRSGANCSLINPNLEELKITTNDYFMVNYYSSHLEDFCNPLHNLKNIDILKYIKRPRIPIGIVGTLYYISNKCCSILIEHMENINYDIFYFDDFTQSYPYTIEDCAVSFILYYNKIDLIHSAFVSDTINLSELSNLVAIATNKYK